MTEEQLKPCYTENEMLKEIDERDFWHDKATDLAEKVGAYFGQEVGEHSYLNCPIDNAIAMLECAPRPTSEWRPMETAPKDGTEVILKVELRAGIRGKCLVGHYMDGGHCIEDHPPIDGGWYFWNGCMFDKAAKPVGWQPLPPPSEGERE